MLNQENSSKSRYIKIDGKKVPVSEEVYKAYYRPIWALHNKMQNHGCCTCTDWRDCCGDCGSCRFRVAGDVSSIEAMTEETGDHADFLSSEEDVNSIVMDKILLDELFKEMKALDPEGQQMCRLYMAGKSERQMEQILNLSHGTFQRHWAKVKDHLAEKLQSYR